MNNVTVTMDGGTPVKTIKPSDYSQSAEIDIPVQPPRPGQAVTLARQDTGERPPFLNVCEVQVWGE